MSFSPGVCPKCRQYIFLKEGLPLLMCPLCDESVSSYESSQLFEVAVSNPQKANQVIAACLKMEAEYGPDMALSILDRMAENFPKNEEVAYLCVKMSGFELERVREYLEQFANTKKLVAFANDFLEGALSFKTLADRELFYQYIENKLPEKDKSKWRQKLVDMYEIYAADSKNPVARVSLYIYYFICTLINIASIFAFVIIDMHFLVAILAVVGLFFVEIGILFLHHRKFGDRFDISPVERLLMVIFMCSIAAAMGGMFIGALI